jgi:hypothetical protein
VRWDQEKQNVAACAQLSPARHVLHGLLRTWTVWEPAQAWSVISAQTPLYKPSGTSGHLHSSANIY